MKDFLRDVVMEIDVPSKLRARALDLLLEQKSVAWVSLIADYSGRMMSLQKHEVDGLRGIPKIHAIKKLREIHKDWSLKDALEMVNHLEFTGQWVRPGA